MNKFFFRFCDLGLSFTQYAFKVIGKQRYFAARNFSSRKARHLLVGCVLDIIIIVIIIIIHEFHRAQVLKQNFRAA